MGGCRSAESQLFSWPSAQLFLVERADGHHRALMQSGTFSLLLTTHSRCPHLALVEACVADLRWPIGKDSLVTISDSPCPPARFIFCFPGEQLVYELHLLDTCSQVQAGEGDISRLQELLQLYASLIRVQEANSVVSPGSCSGTVKDLEEAAGIYWARVGAAVKAGCEERRPKHEDCIAGKRSEMETFPASLRCMMSKRMMKRIQKARRVSAVAKLLSQAMVRGLISGATHVQVQDHEVGQPAECTEGGRRAQLKLQASCRATVIAKVEAITRIVEAVERGGSAACSNDAVLANVGDAAEISANLATWTLNEMGLQLLLNVVLAANYALAAPTATSSIS